MPFPSAEMWLKTRDKWREKYRNWRRSQDKNQITHLNEVGRALLVMLNKDVNDLLIFNNKIKIYRKFLWKRDLGKEYVQESKQFKMSLIRNSDWLTKCKKIYSIWSWYLRHCVSRHTAIFASLWINHLTWCSGNEVCITGDDLWSWEDLTKVTECSVKVKALTASTRPRRAPAWASVHGGWVGNSVSHCMIRAQRSKRSI